MSNLDLLRKESIEREKNAKVIAAFNNETFEAVLNRQDQAYEQSEQYWEDWKDEAYGYSDESEGWE